ncbi:hypothetical protein [Sphingobium phenoxybenzoativorans]|nr:hypothetical protein [Sphingobium phenoxybenzoativorans]
MKAFIHWQDLLDKGVLARGESHAYVGSQSVEARKSQCPPMKTV